MIMPFGKHKGKDVEDVPPAYLLWLYENDIAKAGLLTYIETNLAAIKKQIELGLGAQ